MLKKCTQHDWNLDAAPKTVPKLWHGAGLGSARQTCNSENLKLQETYWDILVLIYFCLSQLLPPENNFLLFEVPTIFFVNQN